MDDDLTSEWFDYQMPSEEEAEVDGAQPPNLARRFAISLTASGLLSLILYVIMR